MTQSVSLSRPSSPSERRPAQCYASVFLAFLALPFSAAQAMEAVELSFTVDEEMAVDGCGGLEGACRNGILEGSLKLLLDPESGTASIPSADLRISQDGQPSFSLELPLADLVGILEGRTIRFLIPPGHRQELAWTMTLTETGLVLGGAFDEGCCDRFLYSFRNVSFTAAEDTKPPTVLMVNGQRFAVEARWTDFVGNQGPGRAVSLNADSGHFWFFDKDNTELVVKVLDACDSWGRFWFFAAGLTDVGVELVVTDLATGTERSYSNPRGRAFEPILDTDAFATCGVEAP